MKTARIRTDGELIAFEVAALGVAVLVSAWLMFFHWEKTTAFWACLLVPLLAFAMTLAERGPWSWDGKRYETDQHHALGAAMAIPPFALFFDALGHPKLLDDGPLVAFALMVGFALTFLFGWLHGDLHRKKNGKGMAGVFLAGAAYVIGATTDGNALFDRSVPEHFIARVLDRHIEVRHSRRSSHTYYYVLVGPWDARGDAQQIEMDEDFYKGATLGRPVCITSGVGALGLTWFEASLC